MIRAFHLGDPERANPQVIPLREQARTRLLPCITPLCFDIPVAHTYLLCRELFANAEFRLQGTGCDGAAAALTAEPAYAGDWLGLLLAGGGCRVDIALVSSN